jgi:hypothetical protein
VVVKHREKAPWFEGVELPEECGEKNDTEE